MLLAGVIGLLFSVPSGAIGTPYFIAFTVAAVAGTLMVVPRGLVLTVAQIPVLFAIVTFFTAWFTGSFADPENGGATATTSKKARLVTSAYPIIQQFPWLLVLLLICAGIAVWRYLEITRMQEKSRNTLRKANKQRQNRDEATVESSAQVRRRLAESDRRVASRSQERSTARRPAADIIRDAEARRQARQEAGPSQRSAFAQRAQKPTSRWQSRPQPGQPQFTREPSATQSAHQHNRRPINRPGAPQRPTPEFSRRQAHGTARVWGEQLSETSSSVNSKKHSARTTGTHRRTEEWPPRQQRPRQERTANFEKRSRYNN